MSDAAKHGRDLSDLIHEACRESPELMAKAFDQAIGDEIAAHTATLRTLRNIHAELAVERAWADALAVELAACRAALHEQWKYHHAEDCTNVCESGEVCCSPLPVILSQPAGARDAEIIAAAQAMADTLEWIWESQTHATRVRDAIDRWRALTGEGEG